jgi:polyisoprenoid-binding protein YceI
MNRKEGEEGIMFFKIIAAAAVLAAPAVAHAQATTPTVPQDTTHSSTRIRTDSTKVDTSNGSIYTKKKTTTTDTTKATKSHTDSTMNVSPIDSTKNPLPPTTKTPPRS